METVDTGNLQTLCTCKILRKEQILHPRANKTQYLILKQMASLYLRLALPTSNMLFVCFLVLAPRTKGKAYPLFPLPGSAHTFLASLTASDHGSSPMKQTSVRSGSIDRRYFKYLLATRTQYHHGGHVAVTNEHLSVEFQIPSVRVVPSYFPYSSQ